MRLSPARCLSGRNGCGDSERRRAVNAPSRLTIDRNPSQVHTHPSDYKRVGGILIAHTSRQFVAVGPDSHFEGGRKGSRHGIQMVARHRMNDVGDFGDV